MNFNSRARLLFRWMEIDSVLFCMISTCKQVKSAGDERKVNFIVPSFPRFFLRLASEALLLFFFVTVRPGNSRTIVTGMPTQTRIRHSNLIWRLYFTIVPQFTAFHGGFFGAEGFRRKCECYLTNPTFYVNFD